MSGKLRPSPVFVVPGSPTARCLVALASNARLVNPDRGVAEVLDVNRVRREYFGSTRPASTAVEVSRLVKDDLLVEIEVIAVRPPAPEP